MEHHQKLSNIIKNISKNIQHLQESHDFHRFFFLMVYQDMSKYTSWHVLTCHGGDHSNALRSSPGSGRAVRSARSGRSARRSWARTGRRNETDAGINIYNTITVYRTDVSIELSEYWFISDYNTSHDAETDIYRTSLSFCVSNLNEHLVNML